MTTNPHCSLPRRPHKQYVAYTLNACPIGRKGNRGKGKQKNRPHELILVLELTILNFYVILIINFLSFNLIVSDSLMSIKLRAYFFEGHSEYFFFENFYNTLMTCTLSELIRCHWIEFTT